MISCSQFKSFLEGDPTDPSDDMSPLCLCKSGEVSEWVYFIMRGTVNIMDKQCLYNYGMLGEGSCFGDISLLLDQPNQYSYYFNQRDVKPLLVLKVRAIDFITICQRFPFSMEQMRKRALMKHKMFLSYKMTVLLKFMQTLSNAEQVVSK